jgi:hypothetical protein
VTITNAKLSPAKIKLAIYTSLPYFAKKSEKAAKQFLVG